MIMGIVATEAPVMISSHWLAFSAENCARPSVMVYFSLLSNAITGHKKEFQFPKKVKMPKALSAGVTNGRAIRVYTPNSLMGVYVEGEAEDISKSDTRVAENPFDFEAAVQEAQEVFE